MKIYHGESVSGGIAAGRIRIYKTEVVARIEAAREKALKQLEDFYSEMAKLGKESEGLDEYCEMVRDWLMNGEEMDKLKILAERNNYSAEYAVALHCEENISALKDFNSELENAGEREAADWLIASLQTLEDFFEKFDEPTIVIADNLTFHDTMHMDHENISAFVTAQGSASTHTAVFGPMLGVPALTAVEGIVEEELVDILMCGETRSPIDEELDGKFAIVDGNAGVLYVEPDEETKRKLL